jgi:hypothetical protein
MGGDFNAIDNVEITRGLAIWTQQNGIQAFPGGGINGIKTGSNIFIEVTDMLFDSDSNVSEDIDY